MRLPAASAISTLPLRSSLLHSLTSTSLLATRAYSSTPPTYPLLITSIGNPVPEYENTLHNTGHTILDTIRSIRGFGPFVKDSRLPGGLVSRAVGRPRFRFLEPMLGPEIARRLRGGTFEGAGRVGDEDQVEAYQELLLEGEDWTLWRSESYMNTSGNVVRKAWRGWGKSSMAVGAGMGKGVLVVLHDELEKPLGQVTVRMGKSSARGHNGIRSIQSALPTLPFIRISIGIGRPQSRDSRDVSAYVLRRMKDAELETINESAYDVIEVLRQIEEGKIG